uniref:Fatty acid hydroxylase domain-containing protein n=1 Tax=Amorphochlora amoebiformis TaxID=1561963 RepID=A0A7S0CUL2_9EUKA
MSKKKETQPVIDSYKSSGVTVLYYWTKFAVLTLYYAILSHFGLLSFRARLIMFCLIAPINRVVAQAAYTDPKNRMSVVRSLFTVLVDITEACVYVYLQTYFTGNYWWSTLILQIICVAVTEIVQYKIFDSSRSDYEVKTSDDPLDYLLAIVVAGTFHWLSWHVTFHPSLDAFSFPLFATSLYLFDAVFGTLHAYSHCIPWIHKKHMVHHQYRRSDLNAFANFYADITDSFVMNCGFFFVAFYFAVCGSGHIPMAEISFVALHTHARYSKTQSHLVFFFEFDLIDLWLKRDRLSTFHARHHDWPDENFAGFGLIQDDLFRAYLPGVPESFRKRRASVKTE